MNMEKQLGTVAYWIGVEAGFIVSKTRKPIIALGLTRVPQLKVGICAQQVRKV
jgi:hypothetical protein